jgi:uncharacterized protein YecE (DUF72 family)
MTARIGTSGWSYPGWKDDFYKGVPRDGWLAYAASRFTGIEINATFYREQKKEILARWRDAAPDGFAFAIKGHRFITHRLKLLAVEEALARQRANAQELRPKLAAVLWQLPRSLGKDLERLGRFAAALDGWPETRHVLEFRHPSWFDADTVAILNAHRLANCISDAADWPMWDAVTTDLVYVRLHGHEATYHSRYGDGGLMPWARHIGHWCDEGREVHVYFDNDAEGAAPWDALSLIGMLDAAGGAPAATALRVKTGP